MSKYAEIRACITDLQKQADDIYAAEKKAAIADIKDKIKTYDITAAELGLVKHLLQQASQLNHKNVSEFLLEAGIMAANQSLADRRRFELEDTQWLAFNAALERPVASPVSKALLHTLLSTPSILE